jgi:hypothetical protein
VSDEAAEALRELAAASLPFRVDPARSPPGPTGVPELDIPDRHPAIDAFDAAARVDPVLGQVYEAGHDGVYVNGSDGSAWRVQPSQLAWAIVHSAGQRIVFSESDASNEDVVVQETLRELEKARALLSGTEAETRTITAFNGVVVAPGGRVTTPWGELRNASSWEAGITFGGEATPTAIVESVNRSIWRVGEPDANHPVEIDRGFAETIGRLALLLPLSLLIGVEREDHYVVGDWLWQTSLIPIQTGWAWTGKPAPSMVRFVRPIKLTEADEAALTDWAARVEAGYDLSIAIAARRALSAVRERVDPEDSLIDAVVACENLFGHGGETEVTFRVTSAITVLLEPNPNARAAYRSRLGRIYKARSQVVHGGVVDPLKLNNYKEEAISTAVRCLRCLFADHRHLLRDRDRGMRLILRAEGDAGAQSDG